MCCVVETGAEEHETQVVEGGTLTSVIVVVSVFTGMVIACTVAVFIYCRWYLTKNHKRRNDIVGHQNEMLRRYCISITTIHGAIRVTHRREV